MAITLAKKSSGYQSWDMLLESERVDTSITHRVSGSSDGARVGRSLTASVG